MEYCNLLRRVKGHAGEFTTGVKTFCWVCCRRIRKPNENWFIGKKQIIGPINDPYLIRYILVRTPYFAIFLHHMIRSDYEKALHDHPWNFTSIVLRGGYGELTESNGPKGKLLWNKPGSVLYRPATWKHRVILPKVDIDDLEEERVKSKTCWTLVFASKRHRRWGFWVTDNDWCWWRKYNQNLGICEEQEIHRGGLD